MRQHQYTKKAAGKENHVSVKKNADMLSEDNLAEIIQRILEEVRIEADPEELTRMRSIFRKNVPFNMRSYVAAYLLMQKTQGSNRGLDRNRFEQKRSKDAKAKKDLEPRNLKKGPEKIQGDAESENHVKKEHKPREKLFPLAEDIEAVTIFFGAGKKRRVRQDLILEILQGQGQLAKDDIGTVRIFDNYSFIQMKAEKAPSLIEKLQDLEIRGRRVQVTLARKKSERLEVGAEGESESENSSSSESFSSDLDSDSLDQD